MTTIKAEISQKNIDKLLSKLANPAPALEQIGRNLQSSTKERISTTKLSPDGTPFAPWSFATALAREKNGTAGRGILYKTGNLYNSIQYQVQDKQVIVGSDTSAPYAKFLQNGTTKMPARPFIGISAPDVEMIRNVIVKHFRQR